MPILPPSWSPFALAPKFTFLHKAFDWNDSFRILDIGSGNHSPAHTKKLYPNCEYHGLDMGDGYRYDDADRAAMHRFYNVDLSTLRYDEVPDGYFDFIMMAHVLEHLKEGERVLEALVKKLKPGGYFYVEYPGQRSTKLPSMRETLNFYDDVTHVRIYNYKEVESWFKKSDMTVLASGTRRSLPLLFLTPVRMVQALLKRGFIQGNVFWDLLGFAEYVFARTNK
ncbi:MAG: class I SAM-dependent methyltransferase [Sphingobacteriales bacterium]|nr:MAG: class I SAM-dependent methyltransferase [Sphingobacteriales bacterium]